MLKQFFLKTDMNIFPEGIIGIDMGQSLTKLAFFKSNCLNLSLLQTKRIIAKY